MMLVSRAVPLSGLEVYVIPTPNANIFGFLECEVLNDIPHPLDLNTRRIGRGPG